MNIKKYTTECSIHKAFPFCIFCGKICPRDLWAYFQVGINACRVLENLVLQSFMKTLYSGIRYICSLTSLFIQQAHTCSLSGALQCAEHKGFQSNILPTLN